VGIFYLIDESCLLQQSTDDILLGKVRSESSTHDRFVKSTAKGAFTIMHYAAQVEYTVAGFIAKNQDSFHPDLLNMLQGSENSFTAKIFDADLLGTTGGTGGGIAGGALAGPDTPAAADSPTPVTTNGAGHGHSPSKSIRSSTHIRTASQDLKPSATTTAPVAPVPSASDKVAMLRRQPTLASSAPTTPSTTRNPIASNESHADWTHKYLLYCFRGRTRERSPDRHEAERQHRRRLDGLTTDGVPCGKQPHDDHQCRQRRGPPQEGRHPYCGHAVQGLAREPDGDAGEL